MFRFCFHNISILRVGGHVQQWTMETMRVWGLELCAVLRGWAMSVTLWWTFSVHLWAFSRAVSFGLLAYRYSTVNHTLYNVESGDGVQKHVLLQGPLGGSGVCVYSSIYFPACLCLKAQSTVDIHSCQCHDNWFLHSHLWFMWLEYPAEVARVKHLSIYNKLINYNHIKN